MSCPCDTRSFPAPLAIDAGLDNLALREARALGAFPQWRTALLGLVGLDPVLDHWRARDPEDLGLMLLEMAAYLGDQVSFYDALIAGETYLGTAELDGARRRLVALLGYLPRPAVASRVALAAQLEGRRIVTLPAGTAFRSGAFDGEPPQVFELETQVRLDPRINRLTIAPVPDQGLPASIDRLLVQRGSVRVGPGDLLVLDLAGTLVPNRVAGLDTVDLGGQGLAQQIRLVAAVAVPAGTGYGQTRLLTPAAASGLWKLGNLGGDTVDPISNGRKTLLLESPVPIRAGAIVLAQQGNLLAARRVSTQTDRQRTLLASLTSTITNDADETSTLVSAPIRTPIGELTLDSALPTGFDDVGRLILHHRLVAAATPLVPHKDRLEQGDPIGLPALRDPPRVPVDTLLLEDRDLEGIAATGVLDAASRSADLDPAPAWGRTLGMPVTLFGNVIQASRGESVWGEVLGTGDGALTSQTFKLNKAPLTYLDAATDRGFASTLRIWVGGVRWAEVSSFYGVAADARVYSVRQDEAGDSFVHFGGGAPLPTGALVSADYRFGAGAASPPAGAVDQLAKPQPGLGSVRNVLPAFGGADAEGPAELAAHAPRSALLLGRAVSLADLEAAAAQVAGVRAVRVAWHWDAAGLRPVAQVRYIGDPQLSSTLRARLRALVEPDAPVQALVSVPQSSRMDMDLEIAEDYQGSLVIAQVLDKLYAEPRLPGEGGLLRAERLGPDGVLFLSHLVAALMAVDGVLGVQGVVWDGTAFSETGRRPAAGGHFDFGVDGVCVNGVTL